MGLRQSRSLAWQTDAEPPDAVKQDAVKDSIRKTDAEPPDAVKQDAVKDSNRKSVVSDFVEVAEVTKEEFLKALEQRVRTHQVLPGETYEPVTLPNAGVLGVSTSAVKDLVDSVDEQGSRPLAIPRHTVFHFNAEDPKWALRLENFEQDSTLKTKVSESFLKVHESETEGVPCWQLEFWTQEEKDVRCSGESAARFLADLVVKMGCKATITANKLLPDAHQKEPSLKYAYTAAFTLKKEFLAAVKDAFGVPPTGTPPTGTKWQIEDRVAWYDCFTKRYLEVEFKLNDTAIFSDYGSDSARAASSRLADFYVTEHKEGEKVRLSAWHETKGARRSGTETKEVIEPLVNETLRNLWKW